MEFDAGLVFVWITVLCMTNGASTADSEAASTNSLNGNYILDLGMSTNNVFLRLLGKALKTRESSMAKFREEVKQLDTKLDTKIATEKSVILSQLCQMHPCGIWSVWTACSVQLDGHFGIKNRTRECGKNTSTCTYKAEQHVEETESELCEGSLVCPKDYTLTSGFCFKYSGTSTATYLQAHQECQKDKGHVVNVNYKVKLDALIAFLTSLNFRSYIWTNGRRDDVGGQWEYTYGGETEFVNWATGYPNKMTSSGVCREIHYAMVMKDYGCENTLHFVCEIP